ncbi:3-isopropylmalate dehydratase small subunit [Candidatus Woesearchaeota archaeon]|nr:3-isopropylmalate dehydratase small subunit [Candidatus Woesearchaeota archaeon]
MTKITEVKGRGIFVEGDDIDTDRIIPARYMKVLDFSKLGQYAFQDARFDGKGKPLRHPFNDKKYRGASILVVNKNFGCGSSREHAPAALIGFGIKAIIGESFAEIFAGNCIANGIPIVAAKQEDIKNLMEFIRENPDAEIRIDIENDRVEYGDFSIGVTARDKKSLTQGTWDVLGEMLSNKNLAKNIHGKLPYTGGFE